MDDLDPTARFAQALDLLRGPSDPCEGPLADVAKRLALLDDIQSFCRMAGDMLTLCLAESMEADRVEVPGVGWLARAELAPSITYDRPRIRTAAMSKIAATVAVDIATGEMRPDWREVATRALDLAERSLGLAGDKLPKGHAITASSAMATTLGLDPGDFRDVTPRGYTVTIEGGPTDDHI